MLVPGSLNSMLVASGFTVNIVISTNTTDVNLKTMAMGAPYYWDGVTPINLTATINSGVYVRASSNATFSFDSGSAFPAGSIVRVINNGIVCGKGGIAPSGSGGKAMRLQVPNLTLVNAGYIVSGGGAGGYGAGKHDASGDAWHYQVGGGSSNDAITVTAICNIQNTGVIACGGDGGAGGGVGIDVQTCSSGYGSGGNGGGGAGEGQGAASYNQAYCPAPTANNATYNSASSGTLHSFCLAYYNPPYDGNNGGALGTGAGRSIVGYSMVTLTGGGSLLGATAG